MNSNKIQEIKERQDAFERKLEELGNRLINIFYATLKTASLYEANNNRYIDQASKLRQVLDAIFNEDPDFSLSFKDGHFFLTETRLRSDHETDVAETYFLENWPAMGISGLSFSKGLDPRELDKFIFFLSNYEPGPEPEDNFNLIKDRLQQLQIEKIMPLPLDQLHMGDSENFDSEEKKNSTRAMARKTFFTAIAVVQDTVNKARTQNVINISKTKRVVQSLIDQIISDEAALLEMTSLRNFDDYTYVHSVNVCVLSLVTGYHLGLDRKRLSDLGVGALMHDIGKMKLPIELINKPDSFNEYDWMQMRKHPIFGVKALLKTRTTDETSARCSSTIFEHHISYDGTGYPSLMNNRKPSLFARIVSIADNYNAMASGRVYHRKMNLPDEVISNMVSRIGTAFDPIILKVFINAMGIFPVGSVVTLSSNEIGIVAKNNPNDLERPQVKIIGNQDGMLDMADVKILDLSKEAGITVTKIVDTDKFKIDIANYLSIG